MPKDSSGRFHLNSQKAMRADKMAPPSATDAKPMKSMEGEAKADSSDAPHTKIFDHSDGSYHTESPDGERVDHASADDLKSHIDSVLFGDGSEQEAGNDQQDNPDNKTDEDPSYRMLSGL